MLNALVSFSLRFRGVVIALVEKGKKESVSEALNAGGFAVYPFEIAKKGARAV